MNQRPAKNNKLNWNKFETAVRTALRTGHYSLRTEKTYWAWIKRFVLFQNEQKPSSMGSREIHDFLSDLAVKQNVSANTQNQALNALVFLYHKVLQIDLDSIGDFPRARRRKNLPVVASRREVQLVLENMEEIEGLMARLLYGTGMRLMEIHRLRVQDILFDQNMIVVRDGKGGRDRRVPLPKGIKPQLQNHLEERYRLYLEDKERNLHEVELPGALKRKYPNAAYEWKWQYVFPASDYSTDPRSGARRRHHRHEIRLQRAVKKATGKAGLTIHFTPQTFRHSFATHLLETGQNIIQFR